LLLYSDKARDKFGIDAVRQHLLQSLDLTNQALERSGANFRYRQVAIEEHRADDSWANLDDALFGIARDGSEDLFELRQKADMVYYVGTEVGPGADVGLAFPTANEFNAIAVGYLGAGTGVMAHELGHVMGLSHSGEGKSYAQGNPQSVPGIADIMAPGVSRDTSRISYYANPNRYTPDYGIPTGIEGKYDAVRAMNERAATVAAFHQA